MNPGSNRNRNGFERTIEGFAIPQTLPDGKYEIGGMVARGGMGAILNARDLATGRVVAMKVMLKGGTTDAVKRFIAEAKITARLEHPNIVPVHELHAKETEEAFYTMKFVRGFTLQALLEKLRDEDQLTVQKYPLAAALIIFQKVCDAVSFAHSRGVIHRDLKPENVMIGEYGEVLVMDWGLAKEDGRDFDASFATELIQPDFATMAGQVLGSPHYMSPEQARGETDRLDRRTDIYSLGAILFHILSLTPAVQGRNSREVVEKVGRGEITPPLEAVMRAKSRLPHLPGNRVPESLRAVVHKAMAFKPEDRYGEVTAFQADIAAYQNGFATSAENASAGKQMALLIKRHSAVTSAILAGLLLLIGVSAVFTERLLNERNVAVQERIAAEKESDRAQKALADLRMTAPTFFALSKSLVDEGRFTEAIKKAGIAIGLDDTNPDYHLLRANLLEANQDLKGAIVDYERVLAYRPDDLVATSNLSLCRDLLKQNGDSLGLKRDVQEQLLTALREQKRLVEAGPLSAVVDPNAQIAEATLRARLAKYRKQVGWSDSRVYCNPDGTYAVNLDNLAVGDLSTLKDQPIADLSLSYTDLSDLGVLGGMHLKRLALNYSKVTSLAPLYGMPLQSLEIEGLPIYDLTPLSGMKLRSLRIDRSLVDDLSTLAGMPLEYLSASNTNFFDLSPLKGMRISYINISSSRVTDITPLQGMPLKDLDISCNQIGDLSAIAQCATLKRLVIAHTITFDLSPLKSLHLSEIDLSNSDVAALAPLAGQPLERLKMDHTYVTDLAPLASCLSLREIVIPADAKNVACLRKLPLQYISTDIAGSHPKQTAAEFWKAFSLAASQGR